MHSTVTAVKSEVAIALPLCACEKGPDGSQEIHKASLMHII